MSFNPRPSRRTAALAPAAALLSIVGAAASAHAADWSWSAGNGFWMTPGNWQPGSVPGTSAQQDYTIRIGDLPGVQNSTVWMNHEVWSGAIGFDELHITDAMTLDMNGREGGLFHAQVSLADVGTRLIVRHSTGPNAYDLFADSIHIGAGAEFLTDDDGSTFVGSIQSAGVISGWGTITTVSNTGAALTNDGAIVGSSGGLTVLQAHDARLDLDGNIGTGQLNLASPFSQLAFQGDQLADSFGGTLFMGTGSFLNMSMSAGWEADSFSTINVSSAMPGAAAQIAGGPMTIAGGLNVGGSHGHLRVLADATVAGDFADVFLGTGDRLEFDGQTNLQGGTFSLSQGARIDVDGPAHVSGGTFNMVSTLPADGVVNFNNHTQWSGQTTFHGAARQNADAHVGASAIVNAQIFDMDGTTSPAWTINHHLTVNAQAIDVGGNTFNGTLNMNTGAVGRLTVNLQDPGDSWTMAGQMNLAGLGILTTTRVAGSPMIVTGNLNVAPGVSQILAHTTLDAADVDIDADATLRMRGTTIVHADTNFTGEGTLENGAGGSMTLRSGANLHALGLTNNATLRIEPAAPGLALVDRFQSGPDAALSIDIAGHLAGVEHDLLRVTDGAARLDGLLFISLGQLLGAPFSPRIGDEFTIITASSGVAGAFANDPMTQVGPLTYEWTVIYNPNDVVVRLDNIVPAPATAALLAMGTVLAARRRRTAAAT